MKKFLKLIGFYLGLNRKAYITHQLQNLYFWRKPIKPYAFIRVCNEIKTIDTALHSILPAVKGGVIGFNSCTDGSKEYILEFCRKYPQFIPLEYSYDIIPACSERYKEDTIPKEHMLDSYYNFVWEKLPQNEWIIKVDVDHIWFPELLEDLYKLPISKKDIVILNRMNLHVQDGNCYINKHNPFTEVGDSWILYNSGQYKFGFLRGWEDDKFFAWEYLSLPKKNRIYGTLTNYHFPIVKSQRSNFNINDWILFEDFDFRKYLIENNMNDRVKEHLTKKEFILKQFERFNIFEMDIELNENINPE